MCQGKTRCPSVFDVTNYVLGVSQGSVVGSEVTDCSKWQSISIYAEGQREPFATGDG